MEIKFGRPRRVQVDVYSEVFRPQPNMILAQLVSTAGHSHIHELITDRKIAKLNFNRDFDTFLELILCVDNI
jgi:hypothetical protein